MRSQLDRIRVVTIDINDITYKLLNEIKDLSETDVEELHKDVKAKKNELKKLKERLQILKDFESFELELNDQFLSNKKSDIKNCLIINNREVFVDKNEDNNKSDDNTDIDDIEYESIKDGQIRSQQIIPFDVWDSYSRFSYLTIICLFILRIIEKKTI